GAGNANTGQETNLFHGLAYYWPRIVEEYHTARWCAVLMAVLIVPAALLARRLRPGGIALLLLFALGLLLTATHPNHKGRYVHSWVALGWLSAGLGAAALLYGPLTERLAAVPRGAAGGGRCGGGGGGWGRGRVRFSRPCAGGLPGRGGGRTRRTCRSWT